MSARDEILSRIATAHRSAPPPALPYEEVARDYRRTATTDGEQAVERLVDRLLDYRALVRRCGPDGIATELRAAVAERGITSLVVPADLPGDWLAGLDVELLVDEPGSPLTVDRLDGSGGVITGCAVAIAETGTLVLDAGPGMGRRVLSLIPDYHLCVVDSSQICGDVPEALQRLTGTRPLTMISGPSATSDIELNRVEGVHGPRTLEVVIVTGGSDVSGGDPD